MQAYYFWIVQFKKENITDSSNIFCKKKILFENFYEQNAMYDAIFFNNESNTNN